MHSIWRLLALTSLIPTHFLIAESIPAKQEIEQLLAQAQTETFTPGPYESCGDISQDIERSLYQQWLEQKAQISDSILYILEHGYPKPIPIFEQAVADAGDTASQTESFTNLQEEGVDEADQYKIGRNIIASVSFDRVVIVDRQSLKKIGDLSIKNLSNVQLLTYEDKLIVLGNSYDPSDYSSSVIYRTYHAPSGVIPQLIQQREFIGNLNEVRRIQDRFFLVINDHLRFRNVRIRYEDFKGESWFGLPKTRRIFRQYYRGLTRPASLITEGLQISGISCSAIHKRGRPDWDYSLSKVFSLDINGQSLSSRGFIGASDLLYMTSNNLYLINRDYNWFRPFWLGNTWWNQIDDSTQITRLGLGPEGFRGIDSGEAPGYVKDRWAFKELKDGDYLSVATTTNALFFSNQPMQNHLTVFAVNEQGSLQPVASLDNFGTTESIRAIRYVNEIAYIVTFRRTDPLFAIDLKDPLNPTLLGELKVPGFSTYLHPLSDARLLGVGYDVRDMGNFVVQEGIKVSLFDVENPINLSELDLDAKTGTSRHIYGKQGSSSELIMNHHAFFFDPDSKLLGLPLIERVSYAAESLRFSGMLLMSWQGDRLREEAKISHKHLFPEGCRHLVGQEDYKNGYPASYDASRAFRVDGRLLVLSPFGLQSYTDSSFMGADLELDYQVPAEACSRGGFIP